MIFSHPKDKNEKRRMSFETINELVKNSPEKLIQETKDYYFSQVEECANEIIKDNSKVVLLSGPSGSGKTTTAKNIADNLNKKGKIAHVVSIDDFYVGKGNYPLLPDGSEDFESVYSLDLDLFRKTVDEILTKDEVSLPRFDFATSSRKDNAYSLDLSKDDIIIFEGIHALNPLLLPENHKSEVFKLYVAVKTQIYKDDTLVLSSREIRLTRRMIRDNLFRNYEHQRTIRIWQNVLHGEEKYIRPFMKEADFVIDTIHPYEIGVYKSMVDNTKDLLGFEKETEKIKHLSKKLEIFESIDKTLIPKTSMIREFIGE